MPKEIERKFLVQRDEYKKLGRGVYIRQGFLNSYNERVVRVRIAGNQAFITIKGKTLGVSRMEFEYEIPTDDAEIMLDQLCEKPDIKKYRFRIKMGDIVWEVDEFKDLNEGLVIAEVELRHENQTFEIPDWIGEEVTGDPRYYNSNLIRLPYTRW